MKITYEPLKTKSIDELEVSKLGKEDYVLIKENIDELQKVILKEFYETTNKDDSYDEDILNTKNFSEILESKSSYTKDTLDILQDRLSIASMDLDEILEGLETIK